MNTEHLRQAVAVVAALVVTGGTLFVLNGLAPGLTTGAVLRDTIAIVGSGGSQFEAYSDPWLAVRGLAGLYLVGVGSVVSVLALLSVREHGLGGEQA